jgi:hypothetical protein
VDNHHYCRILFCPDNKSERRGAGFKRQREYPGDDIRFPKYTGNMLLRFSCIAAWAL